MTLSDGTLSWVGPSAADTNTHIIVRADRQAAVVLPYEWQGGQRHFLIATEGGEQPSFQLRTGEGWEVIEPLPFHVFSAWTAWCEDRPGFPRATGNDLPVLGQPAPGIARSTSATAVVMRPTPATGWSRGDGPSGREESGWQAGPF